MTQNHAFLIAIFCTFLFAENCTYLFSGNTKNNQQQKLMNNRFYQCNNLDGVFEIKGKIENKPVLLIDDIVDSYWTLTVISALLRKAGSGIVYPIALASTTAGN